MTTAVLDYLRVQKSIRSRVKSTSIPDINPVRKILYRLFSNGVNWKIVCFIGFFMILALLIFYVWQINNLTRGSYLINSYEKQISKLSDENKNLQISLAERDFLGQVLLKAQALNFQKVTSVKYIQVLDNSVATAKQDNIR